MRAVVRFVGWLVGGWRPFGLLFGLGAAAGYLLLHVADTKVDVTRFWSAYLAAYSLFLLTSWTLNARKRLVVEEFMKYGGGSHGIPVKGLATLLAMELSRLHNLYVAVEEEGEIPSAAPETSSLQASIGADDVGALLKGAVSAESKFSLGPFEVPAGAVLGVVGQIVQGPRLTGALYADKERVVLTAQLIGDQGSHTWRAEARDATALAGLGLVDELIAKLASQIFADVVLARTVRWQAVLPFSRGLREYRECLPVPAKHRLRLRRAADQFVAAIADSDDFDLAYYNFGVVTLALGEPEAAEAAFLSAISRNPNAPQGHYAVAQQRFTNNRLDPSVAAFCDRVIDLKPSRLGGAQACDLKALSHAVIATERGDAKLLASAGRDANRGAFQSALALLGAEFRRNDRKDASAQVIRRYEVVAGSCYSTVAYIHGIQAQIPGSALRVRFDRWLAVRAMRIAISIDAANPYLYRQLATLYQQLGRRGRAVEAILKAARMRGDDPEFWADASFLLAQWGEVDRAKEVAAGVLKQTARATDAQLQRVRDALALIGSDEAARVHDILRLRRLRAEVWVTRLDKLVARAEQYRKLGDGWREGFVLFVIAEVQQVQKHTDAAIETLAAAVRIMDRSYPGESNRLGMHAIRAEWLHLADRTSEALEEIDLARRLDPLSTWAGEKFARICMALEEWEEGARAWETLLAQEAANADRYIGVAWCLLCLASQESDPVSRKELHLRAEGRLRDAVDLAGPQERGRTHYMLGYALALRGAHEVSIPHLMVAKALAYVKPLTLDLLASSCLGANHYDDAAGHADELIRVVEELLSRGQARTEKLCQDGLNPSYPDELLASAYNAKAYAAAGKGVAFAESHDWVAKAKTHTAEIADPDAQLALRGAVWDTEGWVLVREGNVDEAIPLFQKALAIGATADRYWHLAVALDRKAVAISDPKMQLEAARRAVECCRQVIPLDLWNMFSADANELRARLESRIAAVDPMFSPSQSLLGVPTPGSAKS